MNTGLESSPFLVEAERRLLQRDYRAAHLACMEALRENQQSADAFFYLGIIAFDHENLEKAVEVFDRAIAIDNQQPRYHAHRAQALMRLRRENEALAGAES